MSTVSDQIALKIAKNNGIYVGDDGDADPQCYAVFKIRNSYFGHIHSVVVYHKAQYEAYERDHEVTEILWSKEPITIGASYERN